MKEGYKIFLSTLIPILRHKIPVILFTGWLETEDVYNTNHSLYIHSPASCRDSSKYSQPGRPKLFSLAMAAAKVTFDF